MEPGDLAGMMHRSFSLAAGLVLLLAAAAAADPQEEACRARAERLSGYKPGGLETQVGNVTIRLSGSVALGASRSSGPAMPAAPAFAGAAAREKFEAKRNEKRATRYQKHLDQCMRETRD